MMIASTAVHQFTEPLHRQHAMLLPPDHRYVAGLQLTAVYTRGSTFRFAGR